ncbi:FtsK/SpoIIIE domain-containing protein [Mycobacteroides abscessus]|uniref:FtsK/SpoIIIE domain-containing protein n=1 Tax=Mycobacteroides abscessus TaxID=36809 RepID=UPI000C25BA55|nr:FtsK/SpoIIIE domain-containing protein [Mycobacteroides abscessus]
MVSHSHAAKARAYMREHGVKYQQALQIVSWLEQAKPPANGANRWNSSVDMDGTSWLEALGIEDIATFDVAATWAAADPVSLRVPVGYLCTDVDVAVVEPRELVYVDVLTSTNRSGGVIQGMTGSGKSVLTPAIVSALAALNGPDKVQMWLLQFKGERLLRDCKKLPHVAKVYADARQPLEDVLDSLRAEVPRREELLKKHGATDARAYRRMLTQSPDLLPLPYLVIIADETTEVSIAHSEQWAEFMELVNRSHHIGIALILAVQYFDHKQAEQFHQSCAFALSLRTNFPQSSRRLFGDDSATLLPPRGIGRALNYIEGAEALTFSGFDITASAADSQRTVFDVLLDKLSR